jgi:hypothetical protein
VPRGAALSDRAIRFATAGSTDITHAHRPGSAGSPAWGPSASAARINTRPASNASIASSPDKPIASASDAHDERVRSNNPRSSNVASNARPAGERSSPGEPIEAEHERRVGDIWECAQLLRALSALGDLTAGPIGLGRPRRDNRSAGEDHNRSAHNAEHH